MEFEWDPEKAAGNLTKHGVTFQEAATIFGSPSTMTYFDPDHSDEEDRYVSIGYSSQGRLLIVSHTDRDDHTRIISARRANKREAEEFHAEP